MRFPVLMIVAGVILSLHAIIAQATLSMLMGSMRANQRYGNGGNGGTSGGGGGGYGGYGSYYSTAKPPTIGSIIGSAIDGLQTLKGMVMSPMMDMAANLMMMASNRATTPVPTYPPPAPMSYAPPSQPSSPNYPAAPSPTYGSSAPVYPADVYANGYSGYYSSGSSNNYVSGSASTPVTSYGQDYSTGNYYSSKNDDQQSVAGDASSKGINFYGGGGASSSSSYGKYGKAAAASSPSSASPASHAVKRSSGAGVSYLSTDSPTDVLFTPSVRYIGTAGPVKTIGDGFLWPKRKRASLTIQELA